jgi:hypothetical protein
VTSVTAKRPRHDREELRELLLDTGRIILREEGLGTGVEALNFKRVFDRVETKTGIRLTNASVIRRVWENQTDFQTDVLVTIALDESEDEIDFALEAVKPTLATVDLGTPQSRKQMLRELCRVGGALNARAVRQSRNWPLWIGVWALVASGEPLDRLKKVEAALLSGYDAFTERIEAIYGAMTAFLGFRLREQFTLRHFVIAANSLGQGFGLRDRVDDSFTEGIFRPTGPHGDDQEWTLFAVALEGLVEQFFEIDPTWAPDGGETA